MTLVSGPDTRSAFWKVVYRLIQAPRIIYYSLISSGRVQNRGARFHQPVLIIGQGTVVLGKCNLGVWPSPLFFSGYIHIEAREPTARITIEDGVWINNGAAIVAERASITIRPNALLGTEVTIYDSDFHGLDPRKRRDGTQAAGHVIVGENTFLGSRVTVLKGVTIGANSVVGSGSVVATDIPADAIAAGVPARVIGKVPGRV